MILAPSLMDRPFFLALYNCLNRFFMFKTISNETGKKCFSFENTCIYVNETQA